jgi:hypothetical protein
MAGTNDRYAERLREKARRFDERGRKGTLVQEQVAALDKAPPAPPQKKTKLVEEEPTNG